MNRRRAIAVLLASTTTPVLLAQTSTRIFRIGFLSGASRSSAGADVRTFLLEGLADLGYVQGRNMTWHERYAEADFSRLDGLADELARLPVDVILTQTTPATVAAGRASRELPVVSVTSGDLLGAGVVKSLAKPGGNVTGLSFLGPELAVKQMELLKEIVPAVRKISLLATRGTQPEVLFLREMERAAPALGVSVWFAEAAPNVAFKSIFDNLSRLRIEAVLVAPSILNFANWRETLGLASRARIPLMFSTSEGADAGGLLSYGINRREFYQKAAIFVDRILKGAKPSDLPIEQPTRFELIVNLRSAKTLGVTVPQSILLRADRTIE